MNITVWGSRGSVPVSGPDSLRYGGDTTCVEVRTERGDVVILDAGTGIRPLGNWILKEAAPPREMHFLLTHAHWDHVMGFPFFRPLYRKAFTLRFHGCSSAQESIHAFLGETMRPPFFPVSLSDVGATLHFETACSSEFEIGELRVRTCPLSHPNGGVGFRISERGRSFVFIPDNEFTYAHPGGRALDDYAAFADGADLLIHDAEYGPDEYEKLRRSWGHSAFTDTVRLASKAGVRRLLLWHLNQDRTDAEADAIAAQAGAAARAAGASFPVEYAAAGLRLRV
jgi:phosphoribosyl 1,2-cyclic phosphodiesterase